MIDVIEIMVTIINGFCVLMVANVAVFLLVNKLLEIQNDRRCLVWKEENRGR